MRRLLATLLLLCVAVPAVALAADTDPKRKITPADQAKARSLLLKRTDLVAGFKRIPPSPDSDLICPGFNPDESDLTLTGEAEADFEHTAGRISLLSYAEIWASKADALKSWTRSDKPATARCIGYFFRKGAEEEGAQVKILNAGRMAFAKLAPRTAAFKVVVRVTLESGQTGTITIQALSFGHGRGDMAMVAMSEGAGLPAAELRTLGRLLASRLAAAKL